MVTALTSRIKENRSYLLFLAVLTAVMVFFYTLTSNFRVPETGMLPRLVIVFSLAVILLDALLTLFPQFLPSQLVEDSSASSGFENRDIGLLDVGKEFGWVFAYLAGMFYIGFFTATFGFAFLYILLNGPESSLVRRGAVAAAWAIGINVFLWVLFVELLQVSSVFQFGFFI
jgi:hypothetical protein